MVPFCSGKMLPISRAHLNRLCSWKSLAECFLNISFSFLLFLGKSCFKKKLQHLLLLGGGERRKGIIKKEEKCVKTFMCLWISIKQSQKQSYFRSVAFSVSEMDFIYKSSHLLRGLLELPVPLCPSCWSADWMLVDRKADRRNVTDRSPSSLYSCYIQNHFVQTSKMCSERCLPITNSWYALYRCKFIGAVVASKSQFVFSRYNTNCRNSQDTSN